MKRKKFKNGYLRLLSTIKAIPFKLEAMDSSSRLLLLTEPEFICAALKEMQPISGGRLGMFRYGEYAGKCTNLVVNYQSRIGLRRSLSTKDCQGRPGATYNQSLIWHVFVPKAFEGDGTNQVHYKKLLKC